MAFVSVGLLLGMFFLWRSWGDLSKRYDAQGEQLNTARQEFSLSEDRVKRLLSMLGQGEFTESDLESMAAKFADDPILGIVEKDFAAQKTLFPANTPLSEQNLMKLPQTLLETIRVRNEEVAEARRRTLALEAQMTTTVEDHRKAREAAETAQKKAEQDLAAARQSHAADIAKLNQQKEEAFRKFDAYKADFDKKLTALTAANQALDAKVNEQVATITKQAEIINEYRAPDFAAPQGDVINVAAGGTSVWINLGKEDGLRRGVPFSILDSSEINISDASPKAHLVIEEVFDDHVARARVQTFDAKNPVVRGDKVYSPAWRPGRKVGFALVGKMDINDDFADDIDQIRELIRLAGGTIDDELDSKGNRRDGLAGMSPNTSYVVLGTDLSVSADANPASRQKAEAYAKFISEARGFGIMPISLEKLMGYLKTDSTSRTIPLGNRLRGDDFPVRSPVTPPASTGSVSDIFQPRSPK